MPTGDVTGDGRTGIIEAIKNPLNLVTLLLLIVEGFMIQGSIQSDKVPFWAPILVLVLIIVFFFVTLWRFPDRFGEQRMIISNIHLAFEPKDFPIDLDDQKSKIIITPSKGGVPREQSAILSEEDAQWSVRLPDDIDFNDTIRFELIERTGRQWRVNSFRVLEKTVHPRMVQPQQGGNP